MHAALEDRLDLPAGRSRLTCPRPIRDDDRPRGHPACFGEGTRNEVLESVGIDLRLAAVGRIEDDAVDRVVDKRESGRIATADVPGSAVTAGRRGLVACEEVSEVRSRAVGHLRLRVGSDRVCTDEAGLDEYAAGATH